MKTKEKILPEFEVFIEEFYPANARSAVIIGAAKIDMMLCKTLEKMFVNIGSKADELLDDGNPLGTFSSRINILYRMGIVDKEFSKILHAIRKIRNSFAHDLKNIDLSSSPHKDRLEELLLPLRPHVGIEIIINKYLSSEKNPLNEFKGALSVIILRLLGIYRRSVAINHQHKPFKILPEDWELEKNQEV